MLTDKRTKLLAIRLPEADKRRIKSLAASRGMTLQEAVHQALEAWASQLQPEGAPPLGPLPGPRAGADLQKPRRQGRAAKRTQDKRPGTDGRPGSKSAGGQAQNPEGASLAWLRQAAELDWSKCPAAESVPGKTGSVWVFRGTDIPLADVFISLEEGHPVGEVAQGFGLTREQMKAILQFAAQGLVIPASTR